MLRFLPLAFVTLLVGCDGALTPTGRIVGHWQGRPEVSAERTEREWPGEGKADKLATVLPTDIEVFSDLRIDLRLDHLGEAQLSLDGESELRGDWTLTPGEGKWQLLEIAIEDADGTVTERRHFEIEMLKQKEGEPDRFVLRESGADSRFGRLIFERSK